MVLVVPPPLPGEEQDARSARAAQEPVERYRLIHLGQRDAWAEAVGLFSAGLGGFGVALGGWGTPEAEPSWVAPFAVGLLGVTGVGVAFYLGKAWARQVLLVVPLALGVLGEHVWGVEARPGILVAVLFLTGLAVTIHRDARNQLFFERNVPRPVLERHLARLQDNPLAHRALAWGLGALVIPLYAPLAIVAGAWALSRLDAKGEPPIRHGGRAVAGIALGCLGLGLWWLKGPELWSLLTDLLRG
jgi:hypothetical protein